MTALRVGLAATVNGPCAKWEYRINGKRLRIVDWFAWYETEAAALRVGMYLANRLSDPMACLDVALVDDVREVT